MTPVTLNGKLFIILGLLGSISGLPLTFPNGEEVTSNINSNGRANRWRLFQKSTKAEGKDDDPNDYPSLYPTYCAGTHQSPIDIDPRNAKNGFFPLFNFGNYGRQLTSWKITNNGESGIYSLQSSDQLPYIEGGGLSDRYIFAQFHFHWGGNAVDSTNLGSEHTLKSRQYPAELHIVHYNSKYGSLANATSHSDGLAVLGIFIQLKRWDNPDFSRLLDFPDTVHLEDDNDEANLNSPMALSGILPRRTNSFFRYSGSLTTPVCNEIVTWTVFDDPLLISQTQLTKLRSLLGETGKEENYRPVQPINDRDIYYRSALGARCHLPSWWPISPTPVYDLFWWLRCVTGLF